MKRNCSVRKQRVSGFTLLEMVIVMGIISILLGVLVPTMRTYMTKSRLNTANSNAKVIFNSLQTIMQEYEFSERSQEKSFFYGSSKVGDAFQGNIFLYCSNGNIDMTRSTFKTSSGGIVTDAELPADPDNPTTKLSFNAALGSTYSSAGAKSLGARMGRLFTDYQTVTWCACIQDYAVRGVLCAANTNTGYIGGYPLAINSKKISMEDQYGGAGAEITASNMGNVTEDVLGQYSKNAWSGATVVYASGGTPGTPEATPEDTP